MPLVLPDGFTLEELTAAINAQPHVPGRIGELRVFEEEGITTTSVDVEYSNGLLELVQSSPRGGPGQTAGGDKRWLETFKVPHLQQDDSFLAEAIQNVRAFGSSSETQQISVVRDQKLAAKRRNLDATIEWHRIGAIKGQILDADATTVLFDLFARFGVTRQVVPMDLSTAGTDQRGKCLDIQEAMENELGGTTFSGARVLCGAQFWRDLISNKSIKETYLNTQQAAALRGDPRDSFDFGGLTWERYRGKVGSAAFIGNDEAYAIPEGVSGLFITRFAPADYLETVNTLGLPYYAKVWPMANDKGLSLEAQSNPLNLCTRPRAVIQLKRGAA